MFFRISFFIVPLFQVNKERSCLQDKRDKFAPAFALPVFGTVYNLIWIVCNLIENDGYATSGF